MVRISIFVAITASGVFSSWPASVMKRFCFSMLSASGITAFFDVNRINKNAARVPRRPTAAVIMRRSDKLFASIVQSRSETTVVPSAPERTR